MENTETKVCSKCGLEKSLSEFVLDKRRNKHYSSCKKCNNDRNKEYRKNNYEHVKSMRKSYYENNKNKILSDNKKWVKENRDKVNELNRNNPRNKEYSRKYHVNNVVKRMLQKACMRAKNNDLSFDITIEDIVIPNVCPVLGIPLVIGVGHVCDNSPTLDKIIPEKGYVKGNVRVISYRANMIKNYGNAEEHRKIAEYIEKNSPLDFSDYSI